MNGDSGRLLADICFSSVTQWRTTMNLRFLRCKAYQMPHEFSGNQTRDQKPEFERRRPASGSEIDTASSFFPIAVAGRFGAFRAAVFPGFLGRRCILGRSRGHWWLQGQRRLIILVHDDSLIGFRDGDSRPSWPQISMGPPESFGRVALAAMPFPALHFVGLLCRSWFLNATHPETVQGLSQVQRIIGIWIKNHGV